jgi:hypothetical protein
MNYGFGALLLLASSATAQVDLEWDHAPQFPSPYRSQVVTTAPDGSGGWYATVGQYQYSSGATLWLSVDTLLLRYDAAGSLTSSQSLGGEYGGYVLAVDASGAFWTVLSHAGTTTIHKFDADGAPQVSIPVPTDLAGLETIGLSPSGDLLAAGANSGSPASAGVASCTSTCAPDFGDVLRYP